ncbi:sugar kinase [Secundilactobacillus mixtipabuli]|uniref:2-dehydro-3-deoxygluconokinase n=1 Tax=Secundilactobacillus mixtipabuli TaxID=1435342 RepID=A0A1Z5IF42_9LACO|nr:sugar kinase [Secundilactobacillus mixtipabuli]GAX00268.1 2-dehydro-3-deoxygluconokinase [Secundilactobacillus mixtipabuli]
MSELITIGEPMVVLASQDEDLSLTNAVHFRKFAAGAELNVAIGVARLGHSVDYVSSIGDDPFGRFIFNEVKKNQISTKYLEMTTEYWTGHYLKQRVTTGDPSVYYFRKNSAAANYNPTQIDQIDLSNVKIGHLSGIFAALSESTLATFKHLNAKLNQTGVLTTFDPNLRPSLWTSETEMIECTNELAKYSRIVMPGVAEGAILVGSRDPVKIANYYLDQGIETTTVIVKTGADGAYVKVRGKTPFCVSGFQVNHVVDTVGAGDGFAVGLISGLLEGQSLRKSVERACAIGALAVQAPGDNDGYPTRAQLQDFLTQQKKNRRVKDETNDVIK